jgi:hypothetical protein
MTIGRGFAKEGTRQVGNMAMARDPMEASGRQLAETRLKRYGVELSNTPETEEATQVSAALLRAQGAPDRAVEMIVEDVAIASSMRERYGEPRLTRDDISRFSEVAKWFFNSFWHE